MNEEFFGPASDLWRDANRYQKLLLALDLARQEMRAMEKSGFENIEPAIVRLLPHLTEALGGAFTFLGAPGASGNSFQILAVHPANDLVGQSIQVSPQLLTVLQNNRTRIFQVMEDEKGQYIAGLESWKVSSAILAPIHTAYRLLILGICNRIDPSWGPYVSSDRMALDSILELVLLGMRIGEKRRHELQHIQEISAEINAEQDLEPLLELVTQRAAQVFEADATSLMLWDESHENLVIRASCGLGQDYVASLKIPAKIIEGILLRLGDKPSFVTSDLKTAGYGERDLIEKEQLFSALTVALRSSSHLIGALNIYSKKRIRQFGADEEELAGIFGNQAAIAIRNAELRASELAGLLDTSAVLRASLDQQAILDHIVKKAREVFQVDAVSLMLWNEQKKKMVIKANQGLSQAYADQQRITRPNALQAVTVDGKFLPKLNTNLHGFPYGNLLLYQSEDLLSVLNAPLLEENQLVGILNLYLKNQERVFNKQELDLAQIFANQSASAIALTHHYHESHQREEQLAALDQIAIDIASRLDRGELFNTLVKHACRLLNTQGGGLYLWDSIREVFILESSVGLPSEKEGEEYPKDIGIIGEVYRTKKPKSVDRYLEWEQRRRDLDSERLSAAMGVPVYSKSSFLGVLVVHDVKDGRTYSINEINLLERFANHAAAALENANAYQREQQARRELEIIMEAIQNIAQADDLAIGLKRLADLIVSGLNVSFAHIILSDGETLEVAAASVCLSEPKFEWQPRINEKLPAEAIQPMLALTRLPEPMVFQPDTRLGNAYVLHHVQEILEIKEPFASILILPMRVGDKTLGFCTLGERRHWDRRPFNRTRINLAKSITDQAVVLIDRFRTHEITSRRFILLDSLRKVGERMSRLASGNARPLLDYIAESACQVTGADSAVIYPLDPDLNVYDVANIGAYNLSEPYKTARPKWRDAKNSMSARVLQKGGVVILDDISSGWDREKQIEIGRIEKGKFLDREEVQSFLAVELKVGEQVGVLFLNNRRTHFFTEEEIDTARLFANQAAVTIQQARLLRRGEKEHGAMQAMSEITGLIGRRRSSKTFWRPILLQAMKITKAQRGRVLLWDPARQIFSPIAEAGFEKKSRTKGVRFELSFSGLFDKVASEKKPYMTLDSEKSEYRESLLKAHPAIGSLIIAPIIPGALKDQETIGMLALESSSFASFDPDDLRISEFLAQFAGIALQVNLGYNEAEENVRLQKGLWQAGQEILTRVEDSAATLRSIVENMQRALGCDLSILFPIDPLKDQLQAPVVAGTLNDSVVIQKCGSVVHSPILTSLLEAGVPVFADNAMTHPEFGESGFIVREHIRSSAGIPLLIGKQRVGVLFINYRNDHPFPLAEQSAFLLFATQAALAIHNAHLFEAVEKKRKHQEAVYKAGKVITASIDLQRNAVLDNLLEEAVEAVTAAVGRKATIATYHGLYEDDLVFEGIYPKEALVNLKVDLEDRRSIDPQKTADGKIGIVGLAATKKTPILVKDVREKRDEYIPYRDDSLSELSIPLIRGNLVIGVLDVETDQTDGFNEDDKYALMMLADLAVIALENIERADKLRRSNTIAVMGAWGAEVMHDLKDITGHIRLPLYVLRQRSDLPIAVKEKLDSIDQYAGQLFQPVLPKSPPRPGEPANIQNPCLLDQTIRSELGNEKTARLRAQYQVVFLDDLKCGQIRAAIDEPWLRRLLRHLLTNASKAFPIEQTDREVWVRSRVDNLSVIIEVSDNGPGINPNIAPYLFKQPIIGPDGREGVGLLLVDFLIQLYGGTASLSLNCPGKGACFALKIPITSAKAA